MGRSTTGESSGVFHTLRLVEHVVGATGDFESHLRLIQEIFLQRADVKRAFDALDDANPACMPNDLALRKLHTVCRTWHWQYDGFWHFRTPDRWIARTVPSPPSCRISRGMRGTP